MDQQADREAAVERIEARRDLRSHVLTYVIVNSVLIVIWAATGAGYFWPIWPLAGWGLGLVLHAWRIIGERPITEDEIRREQQRSHR